jgi:hypothetical protein
MIYFISNNKPETSDLLDYMNENKNEDFIENEVVYVVSLV